MEFFIRKNATLPIIEVDIIKDGKLDYNYQKTQLSASTIYFSMKDVETGFYRITNGLCTFDTETYSVYYQFTKKNTRATGRFEGEFKITTSQGTVVLPLRDSLYVTILDSIVNSDFCCSPTGNIVTPTLSPVPTPTPTPTPSPTPTAGPTPTPTPTPSPTPTPTPTPNHFAYLFVEPSSGSSVIGQYMYDEGVNFYGFTNGTLPTLSQNQFNIDMNTYVDFSGWTGSFPTIITSIVPQVTGGVDSFGQLKEQYNFQTVEIATNTIQSQSWYTWIIPTGATGGEYQTEIDFNSNGNVNAMSSVLTNSSIYNFTFTYTGGTIPQDTYRVYTTAPASTFYLNNTDNIYFKGSNTTP